MIRALLQVGFISAQRGLDDTTHKDINLLGKILEELLTSAMSESADAADRDIAKALETAVGKMQEAIDGGFNRELQKLLPTFSLFGYPGLSDPQLLTETTLDVLRLLKDHTKVHYAGANGVNLPETYNGLGVRNLIFILLKLVEFFKSFKTLESAPGVHLVFIEEPEVHLHPQMQEVFISKLSEIAAAFAAKSSDGIPWPVQFVVTTHSSHVANKAPFESIRYFLAAPVAGPGSFRAARIKDLRGDLGPGQEENRKFVHKYMTLTRCDLLFADKAVLIEGTSERLMLPRMIDKVDAEMPNQLPLSRQYVSAVEVGGAYAHCFFSLLSFLELPTLVITDLDAVNNNRNACKVSEGTSTSNACIKEWFGGNPIAPAALLGKTEAEKTHGNRRLAYQIPEADGLPCGRSFEDAFMLANGTLFRFRGVTKEDREEEAWTLARDIKKSDFALEHGILRLDWIVPRYIAEGLHWLASQGAIPDNALPPPAEHSPDEEAVAPPEQTT